MTLESGIKGGKESLLKQIRFFFFFLFSLSTWEKADCSLQWVVWVTETEKTHQATACLLVQWLCCCPPPSLACFAPTWQTLYADLFLNCFWFLCGTSCRGAESREQTHGVGWLYQPCPAWWPHSLAQNMEAASSTRFLSSSQSECVCICLHLCLGEGKKKSQTKIQRKKKERKRKDQSVNCKTSCGARWKWKQGNQWDNRWGCNWSAFSSSSLE